MTDETRKGAGVGTTDALTSPAYNTSTTIEQINNIALPGYRNTLDQAPHVGDFAAMGWKMFPVWHIVNGACACQKGVNCDHPGKHPRTRTGVKEATNNVDVLRAWWESFPGCNWGLACGRDTNVFVVDLDPSKGAYDSFEEFELQRGEPIPVSLIAHTGGGGRHLYFSYPETKIMNRVEWLPGVDVRSDGGYVILPPGNHISGGEYRWENWGTPLVPAPQDLISALADSRSGGAARDDLGSTDSLMQGIEEGSRDEMLFRLACRLRRELRDSRRAVEVLILDAAAHCSPPFPEAEALAKVDQAFKQDHADSVRDRVPFTRPAGMTPHARAERLAPGGKFVFDEPDQIPSLWGSGERSLWAEGEGMMIAGPQGLGKTTLVQQLTLARYGLLPPHFLGLPVAQSQGKALYLAMDRPRQAARSMRRMVGVDQRAELDEHILVWKGPTGVRFDRDPAEFADWVQEVDAAIDLVVVDSVKDLASGLSTDDVGSGVNRAWQELIARGIQLVVLHHERKSSDGAARSPGLDHIYGSTWLTSGLGSVLQLVGTQGDPSVELHHVKQPAAEVGPLTVLHDHALGVSRIVEQQSIESVLASSPDPMTVKQIASAASMGEKTVQRRLAPLLASGDVIKTADATQTGGGRSPARYQLAMSTRRPFQKAF